MADANREAAAKGSPTAATRGRFDERFWADLQRAARVAHEERVKLRVRRDCVDVIGVLKQHTKMPCKVATKDQKKPTNPVEPALSSTVGDEASPPTLSKHK